MTDWTPLDRELGLWRAERRDLPVWWRDDDAISPTPELERLLTLSERLGCAVHLAVIPARAIEALAGSVAGWPVLVHGWAHHSHAPEDEKKAEFGAHRPIAGMAQEAGRGLALLRKMTDADLVPMFVPPWNRMTPALAPALPAQGFKALSTYQPRRRREAAPRLVQINTHLDPIDWRGTRSALSPDTLVAQVAADLAARRRGETDAGEPYGILTHHLVHDAAIWKITETLLARLFDAGARSIDLRKDLTGDKT